MRDTTALPPCDRCHRPAKRRALYYRVQGGSAILAGRYGGSCFYKVADTLYRHSYQVEHEDARVIRLRRVA
ncbi:hypothetical protein [Actinoplanes sp. NPDC049802]|uniref:hypothetical protein n=1 Tax=Actinoplanes sp. NPDC049802 TaxID=3154742 RepID=UPI0033D84BC7